MSIPNDFDVLICGGGLVGLTLAKALAASSLRVALLDRDAGVAESDRATLAQPRFDARVSALTPASQALLDQLGVWREIAALRVCAFTGMRVWDADGTGSIDFNADELHAPCLGYIAENSLVAAVLTKALRDERRVTLLRDSLTGFTTQDGEHLVQLASGATVACRLLIGADGTASRVRELAGFDVRAWDYGQRALVTTVRTALPHGFTAWQRFMQSGPLAFLPLYLPGADAQHHSSIVWSCVPELADALLALDDKAFAQRLGAAFEHRLGAIEQVAPRVSFELRQQHAGDYVRGGIALIGDAAHTIHPLAGQGVNLGLADVESLAGVLQRACDRGEDFASEQVLSRYQRARKAANLGMMLVMEGFKRAFGSDDLRLRWLRNAGLRAADSLRPFKQAVMRGAMGLK